MNDDMRGLAAEILDDLIDAEGIPARIVLAGFMAATSERLAELQGRDGLLRWSDALRQAAMRGKAVGRDRGAAEDEPAGRSSLVGRS